MLFPMLTLKRTEANESCPGMEFLIAADAIGFVSPLAGGGSRVYSNCIPDDEADDSLPGECYIDVTASPSMIYQMINEAIAGHAELSAAGTIRAQYRASKEIAKTQSPIARPFNGAG